jgi:hypothetical protein
MSQDGSARGLTLAAIGVIGPDAAVFVQSQLTMDVDSLSEGLLRPGAWCRPDGRVAATVLVARQEGRCWIVLPAGNAQAIAGKLRMFSIGRQVEIQSNRAAVPGEHDGAMALEFDRDRRLCVEDAAAPEPLPGDWLRRDIALGMPWLVEETQGRFLPQMLGLEALGGLSYAKGCYPGQEVIARVHYRGRVTRRTARFELACDEVPEPGAEAEIEGESAVVLYAARSATDNGVEGLVVVPAESPANAPLRLAQGAGKLVGN